MKIWGIRLLKVTAALLCALAQTTIVPSWSVWGVKPDFPLITAFVAGLMHGPRSGWVWGAVLGVGVDGLSLAPFGTQTVLISILGGVAGLIQSHVNKHYMLVPALMFFLIGLVHMGLYGLAMVIAYPTFVLHATMVWKGMAGAFYGALLAPWILKGYLQLTEWWSSQRMRRRQWSA